MIPGQNSLLILIPGFPKDENDSTCLPFPQAFVRNMHRRYPELKLRVMAFQYPFFAGSYNWNGIQVEAFNGRNRGNIQRLFLWKRIWKRMNALCKVERPSGILNFWLGETALLAKKLSEKYSIPYYTWMMGQDALSGNRYMRLVKPRADTLIAVSDFNADMFSKHYGFRPALTIPPGIDATLFKTGKSDRDIDVLGAGSLISLKQFQVFVECVARLVVKRPHLKAILCGSGPEREHIEALIRKLGIEKNIILSGEIAHSEVLSLMQRTKVFLHPSKYEGFSTVCAEALFAGAGVISFVRPMKADFKHWQIAETEQEMTELASAFLNDPALDHHPVLTYPMDETCDRILSLYI